MRIWSSANFACKRKRTFPTAQCLCVRGHYTARGLERFTYFERALQGPDQVNSLVDLGVLVALDEGFAVLLVGHELARADERHPALLQTLN